MCNFVWTDEKKRQLYEKHWISTIDAWDEENKILAHGLLFGCIPQL